MTGRIPWTKRTFEFNFPAELHYEILERLRGTPARVEELVRALPPEILTKRDGDAWSIQENVGHLGDVEELWAIRLDEYERGEKALFDADMANPKTHDARHNDQPLEAVLEMFRQVRGELVARLERLEPNRFAQSALHKRLNQPMRIVDMMYFIAEHDDYHVAHITQLARKFS